MTEHTTSYYAASANKYAPFPTLSESISCDVCVVGGGYTGLSSALHLAEMGYDVVLLESPDRLWRQRAQRRPAGKLLQPRYRRD